MSLNFNSMLYRYPSRRSVTYAQNGMVCTSQSLAAQAGLEIMKKGGNAIDAAIATAACLTVLEPTGNGLGSDVFALVWVKDKLYGLNGSGYAPKNLTKSVLQSKGFEKMPERGWETVTVPGAPSAWFELHKRFGKLAFKELLQPAISYAENGYPVSPVVADLWKRAEGIFAQNSGEAAFEGMFSTFMQDGKAPVSGQLVKMPGHARTLRLLAESNCEEYYHGIIAEAIAEFSQKTGGYIRKEDLEGYCAEWVEPIKTNYRGYDVWEIPPNGHGIVALMTLNLLHGFAFEKRDTVDTFHKQIEAMKLAFSDGKAYVADPRYMKTKVNRLLSKEYADVRRREIGEQAIMPKAGNPNCGGTVYLCTADNEGNMVSFIQSNFKGFGSGIVISDYGIALNNRGNGFSLKEEDDNFLLPGKKPYHTIIPGFLSKNGKAIGPFGVMGGFMQPQGHVQVIMNTLDFAMNPQEALDAPRWQWLGEKTVEVENSVPSEIIEGLRTRGHEIIEREDFTSFGRGQIIWRDEAGVLAGATEPRADGTVAAW